MTVILAKLKLAYFAVPKVACTTIKTKLFQVENETKLEELRANGRKVPIHQLYPTREIDEVDHNSIADFRRFAVVRDPIKRFVSAFNNRVTEKNEIENSRRAKELIAKGLPLKPDLKTFIENFDQYCVVRGISHHFSPMTRFLGEDAGYFERVFDISESSKLIQLIEHLSGRTAKSSRHNVSSKHHSPQLVSTQEDWIRNYYRSDYDVFGSYFC